MSRIVKDLTDKRFGRLTVVERAENRVDKHGKQRVYWLCRCDCGKLKEAQASCLMEGGTKSCGCLRSEISGKNIKKTRLTDRTLKGLTDDEILERKFKSQLKTPANTTRYVYHRIELYKASLTMKEYVESLRKSFSLMR